MHARASTGDGVERSATAAKSRQDASWPAAASIATAASVVYLNTLANAFALDDTDVIANNPLTHQLSGVGRAFAHTYWPEASRVGQYRPLTIAAFTVDWVLSHGSPVWMHGVNIVWHVIVCLLLWRLLRTLASPGAAWLGAMIFAVHPVHVEAVANLVGRAELMCAAFVLAAWLAHRRGSWIAAPFLACALFAKESGIVFVGLALASDVLIPGDPTAARTRMAPPLHVNDDRGVARSPGQAWHLYAAYGAIIAGYVGILDLIFWRRGLPLVRVAAPWQHATALTRWLTVLRTVPHYWRLLLFPLHLHIDYLPRVIDASGAITPDAIAGAGLVVVALLLAIATRHRARLIALAIVTFAVAISPVSNVLFPSGVVLAERTLYLPSVSVAFFVTWTWATFSSRRAEWPPRYSRLVAAAAALALIGFGARTWLRNPVWRSTNAAILASLRDEPLAYRAHERAADVLERAGDTTAALREYAIARHLYPDDAYLYEAAATMLSRRGADGRRTAIVLLDSARLVDPSPYDDAIRRAWARYAAGDFRGAIGFARVAYTMYPDSVNAVLVLTQAAQQINDVPDADAAFRRALADHPRDPALHRSYAAMLASVGDTAGARREQAEGDGAR